MFPFQLSCPAMRRRTRPTMPAQEVSTGWIAFPHARPTPPTPPQRPLEAEWRRRWRAAENRRSWTPSSSRMSTWRSRYQGEPGWRTRWDQFPWALMCCLMFSLHIFSFLSFFSVYRAEICRQSHFHHGWRSPNLHPTGVTASSWSVEALGLGLCAGWWRSPSW